ncbi:MAG: DUF5666 domain-containing protein [Chloroflexi bacterium]|nr:DUF5666 domain-containing protein [Chloroflexota bacterium]
MTESDGTTQVTIKYTSTTRFMLDGVTSLAVGQQVTAGGQTNDDGSLTAAVVRVAESSSTGATA